MENEFIENVYDTLNGETEPAFQVPGVVNAFAEGSECELLYGKVYDAQRRLEVRLGVEPYDRDVEEIISSLQAIQRELCFQMYYYGAKFGMQEKIDSFGEI